MLLFTSLVLTGCVTTVDVDLDLDEDGLLTSEEVAAGTDPDNPDSDGDEFSDGAEIQNHTNPLDETDKPYIGGWTIGACRDDVESTGSAVGDVMSDFSLPDQFGESVRLYDFCDRVVYLVFAAFW